ncbi:MAG: hypothetical protein WBM09_04200, partial [Gallionella sp.]
MRPEFNYPGSRNFNDRASIYANLHERRGHFPGARRANIKYLFGIETRPEPMRIEFGCKLAGEFGVEGKSDLMIAGGRPYRARLKQGCEESLYLKSLLIAAVILS